MNMETRESCPAPFACCAREYDEDVQFGFVPTRSWLRYVNAVASWPLLITIDAEQQSSPVYHFS